MRWLYLPLFAVVSLIAADERPPIDKELQRCLADERAKKSDEVALDCYSRGEKAWDAELTKAFDALVAKAPDEEREKARAHQEEWAKGRDVWFAQFAKKGPAKVAAAQRVEFLKERVLHLQKQIAAAK